MSAQRAWKHVGLAFVAFVFAGAITVFIPYLVNRSVDRMVNLRVEKEVEAARVVSQWRAENWSTSDGGRFVEADIYGKKQINARFVGEWNVAGLATVDGVVSKIEVEFLADTSPGATRPAGLQSFGRWRFIAGEGQRFESGDIIVSVAHDIDGKSRLTDAGPFFYVAPP